MSYEFHPEAERELYEAALRYESEVPQLVSDSVMKSSESFKYYWSNPDLGSCIDDELRHLCSGNFPSPLFIPSCAI
jgi:hypothetical protein